MEPSDLADRIIAKAWERSYSGYGLSATEREDVPLELEQDKLREVLAEELERETRFREGVAQLLDDRLDLSPDTQTALRELLEANG